MNPVRRREMQAPAIVLSVGLATILGAWGFELIGNYVPCKLCLEQRLPYYVGLPVVLADPGCVPADVAGKVRAGGIEAVLRFVASSMPAGWAGR